MSGGAADDRTALLEEYRQLKAEMGEWSRVRNQFISFSLTAAAALYGLGFQWKNPYLFLSALVVQLPTMAVSVAADRSVIVLGTYIQVAIESRISQLNWETLVHKRLLVSGGSWLQILGLGVGGFIVLPPILSTAFAGLYWPWVRSAAGGIQWTSVESAIFVGVVLAVTLSAASFVVALLRGPSFRKSSLEAWTTLVSERSAGSPDR